MNTYIYMVRHAESPFIVGKERTRGLSEQGIKDSMRVADILFHKDIEVIASSTYKRAIQTVQELANRKGIIIEEYEELRERPIKGLDYRLQEDQLIEVIKSSFINKDYCLDGGESLAEAQRRAIPVIMKLISDYEGKHIVIGTHGNIMAIIINYFDSRYGFSFWKKATKPDIYELKFNKEKLLGVVRLWE